MSRSDDAHPGIWPTTPAQKLVGRPGAQWRPLEQKDLTFMADWGLRDHAGDVDRMIALIKQQSGSRNIFLAGHSQGASSPPTPAGSARTASAATGA